MKSCDLKSIPFASSHVHLIVPFCQVVASCCCLMSGHWVRARHVLCRHIRLILFFLVFLTVSTFLCCVLPRSSHVFACYAACHVGVRRSLCAGRNFFRVFPATFRLCKMCHVVPYFPSSPHIMLLKLLFALADSGSCAVRGRKYHCRKSLLSKCVRICLLVFAL